MSNNSQDKHIRLYAIFSMVFAPLTILAFLLDMFVGVSGATMLFPFWFLGLKKFCDIRYEAGSNGLSKTTIVISVIVFIIDVVITILFLYRIFTPITFE